MVKWLNQVDGCATPSSSDDEVDGEYIENLNVENSPVGAENSISRNEKIKCCLGNLIVEDEVPFEVAFPDKVQNGRKSFELATREIESTSHLNEKIIGAGGALANHMSVMIPCSDLSPRRKSNPMQMWKSFESGANSFCTDSGISIWQQCRTSGVGKSQGETVWAKPNLGLLDIPSSMSQTTESVRDEHFEWETFLSPFSSAANVLQTPERSKTGPGKSPPSFMFSSTPESTLSLFKERLISSPPLKDSDFSLPFDTPRVCFSPLTFLLEDHFIEENRLFCNNGKSGLLRILDDSGNNRDFGLVE